MTGYSSIIYKADKRVTEISGDIKRFSSFGIPFGNLKYVNDIFLPAGGELDYKKVQSVQQIILPVTGAVAYSDTEIKEKYIASEEVLFPAKDDKTYRLKNPYDTQNINYLQIGLSSGETSAQTKDYPVHLSEFNKINSLSLHKISANSYGGIGLFKGRTKGSYHLKNPNNGIFAYVINGAFEMEERLLEHRDGLALWDLQKIDFEALSEYAILLLLEIPLNHD